MRGEKRPNSRTRTGPPGSPPHARGKGIKVYRSCNRVGITPACAGKSCSVGWDPCHGQDHPRMRGEKLVSWQPERMM